MSRIIYKEWNPRDESLALVKVANAIIALYQQQDLKLTLRQLYYQFVSRGVLPNTQRSYSRLGEIIDRARLGGYVDWEAIEDRTRWLRRIPMWDGPADHLRSNAEWYATDKWARQPTRVEVWEKDALSGVFDGVCTELEVPYFPCRGYVSQSEMWAAARRINGYVAAGQDVVVLHFGDHDPSGIQMSEDIHNRVVELFGQGYEADSGKVFIDRIALNMDQVQQYQPPPNPAKDSDSRFKAYKARFGGSSWELDALEPSVLRNLVRTNVLAYRDEALWNSAVAEDENERRTLEAIADNYDKITAKLTRGGK